MFGNIGKAGRLNVQFLYFCGLGECQTSKFVAEAGSLKQLMISIHCRSSQTQASKVLAHALKETATAKVNALVYIFNSM